MAIFINIVLIFFFVLMNGFFVVAEFAMVKVRKSRIDVLVSEGSPAARHTQKVVNDLNTYLSACQLGITLASLALGWLGEPTVSTLISPLLKALNMSDAAIHTVSVIVGFTVITGLHIVLGELVPKSLAILKSERLSTATALPLILFYRASFPIMWLFNKSTNLFLKLLGLSMSEEHEAHTDEEIKLLVEESYKHGLIDKTEYTYVDNIFDNTDKDVRDIMIPRTEMVCIFKEDSFETILDVAMREKYTRYPVCDGDKDSIIGFIHIRDLYEQKIKMGDGSIDGLIRKILLVPKTIQINDMLKRFQKEKVNIAVVIDEYGGTAGMVTLEDILEEIVGDISDEYDEDEKDFELLDSGTYLVKGTAHLDDIEDLTDVSFPDEEYETLNGFLLSQLGRIPTAEEHATVEYDNLIFKVEHVTDTRIELVKICKA